MKKTLIALLALVLSAQAFAQFEQGKSYISTSLSGLNLNYNSTSKWNFDINANAGHFIVDDIMLVGTLDYHHNSSSSDFKFGVGGRYYIEQNGLHIGCNVYWDYKYRRQNEGSMLAIYGASLLFGTDSQQALYEREKMHPNTKKHNFQIGPEIGYTFFLNQHVTIEPAIYYNISLNDYSKGSEVGIRIGFGYFFDTKNIKAKKDAKTE